MNELPEYDYTPEELSEAKILYDAECDRLYYKEGYAGDFGSGLAWVMATYNPEIWKHYFKRPPREK